MITKSLLVTGGSVPLLRLVQGKGRDSILTTYYIGFKLTKPFQMGELINRLILEEQTITATGFDGYTDNFISWILKGIA